MYIHASYNNNAQLDISKTVDTISYLIQTVVPFNHLGFCELNYTFSTISTIV